MNKVTVFNPRPVRNPQAFQNIPTTGKKLETVDNRFIGLGFDQFLCTYYTNKLSSAATKNLDFSLSLAEMRKLLLTKRCPITGVELTHGMAGTNLPRSTDLTIDRLDNSKGYIKGNVMAMSYAANQVKGGIEAYYGGDTIAVIHEMSKNFKKKGF